MFEYAALTAAVSVLTTSLGGLTDALAGKLAASNAVAITQSAARARAVGLSPASARVAYAHAPYPTPALRYVYVNGWIAGKKNPLVCVAVRLAPDELQRDTAKQLRGSQIALRRLRHLHVTVVQAAAAFAKGLLAACGG